MTMTMQEMEKKTRDHYAQRLAGVDSDDLAAAAWWDSQEGQYRRFEVLWDVGVEMGDRVLDLGCGPGAMFEWAGCDGGDRVKRLHSARQYVGVDLVPEMVRLAKTRFPTGTFECRNIVTESLPSGSCDWVLASGLFAWHAEEPELVRAVLRAAFRVARQGIAFNALSSWGPGGHEGQTLDPIATLEIVRSITPYCAMRHDYAPHDWTIYAYHGRQGWNGD